MKKKNTLKEAKLNPVQAFVQQAKDNEEFIQHWASAVRGAGFPRQFNYRDVENQFCSWMDGNSAAMSPASERKCFTLLWPTIKKKAFVLAFGEPEKFIGKIRSIFERQNPCALAPQGETWTYWQSDVEDDSFNIGYAAAKYLKLHDEPSSEYDTHPGTLGYVAVLLVSLMDKVYRIERKTMLEWMQIVLETPQGEALVDEMANAWTEHNPNTKRLNESVAKVQITESDVNYMVDSIVERLLAEGYNPDPRIDVTTTMLYNPLTKEYTLFNEPFNLGNNYKARFHKIMAAMLESAKKLGDGPIFNVYFEADSVGVSDDSFSYEYGMESGVHEQYSYYPESLEICDYECVFEIHNGQESNEGIYEDIQDLSEEDKSFILDKANQSAQDFQSCPRD